MLGSFELRKTASAILCTILFSTTCVLSAVGPARASDTQTVRAIAANPVSAPLA